MRWQVRETSDAAGRGAWIHRTVTRRSRDPSGASNNRWCGWLRGCSLLSGILGQPGFFGAEERLRRLSALPVLMTPAVSGAIFRVFIWNDDTGLANWVIVSLGGVRQPWRVDAQLAMIAVILTEVWVHLPLAVLVLHSAVRSVPRSLHEAATIDGANGWRQFWHISMPYIRPQIVFVAMLQTTLSFRQFTIIYLTTGGGPAGATRVPTMQIFETAMGNFNFGYGNARGVLMLIMVGVVCAAILVTLGRTTDAIGER